MRTGDVAFKDISPILRGLGCYARRDNAIREVLPEFGEGLDPLLRDRRDRLYGVLNGIAPR